jgi:hypothetical protein
MNTEMLRKGVERKNQIDAVAKELGYESTAAAAHDLRSLGVLEGPAALGAPEPEPEPVSTLDRKRISKINRKVLSLDQLSREPYLTKALLDERFTCREFSFLMKGVGWSIEETMLFEQVIHNIIDLENFRIIPWNYRYDGNSMRQKYAFLYPEIQSGKKSDRTPRPDAREEDSPEVIPKVFSQKGVGIIAAVSAFVGFLLGALLL